MFHVYNDFHLNIALALREHLPELPFFCSLFIHRYSQMFYVHKYHQSCIFLWEPLICVWPFKCWRRFICVFTFRNIKLVDITPKNFACLLVRTIWREIFSSWIVLISHRMYETLTVIRMDLLKVVFLEGGRGEF